MPSLTDLPTEILENIIQHAISYSEPPPKNPHASKDRIHVDHGAFRTWDSQMIKYQAFKEHLISSPLTLLLVNRLFRDVTKSLLPRVPACCEIDVMVVDNAELWPTWTYISYLSPHVTDLKVTIRLFGTGSRRIRWSSYPPESMGHRGLMMPFYHLLERFLTAGQCPMQTGKENQSRTIRNLTIAVVSPPTPADARTNWIYDQEPDESLYQSTGFKFPTHSPESMAHWLLWKMNYFLEMSGLVAYQGAVLYERIGNMCFCWDGKVIADLCLAEKLAGLEWTHPGDTFCHIQNWDERIPGAYQWKERAVRMREQAGLNVVRA